MEHDAGAVAAEGGDPTLLATHAFSPQWSPDGKRLVFERCATTSLDCDIWVMDANGANEGALVSGPTFDSAPAWAPDGSRVAFSRSVRDADHEVMVVDADGENVRPVGTGPIAAGGPTWTPDGKSILFARSLGFQKGYDVWTIGADGSGLRRFLRRSCVPEWSPDGGRIVFVRPCDSEFQDVWVAAADGGNARRIATRAFGPTWRPAVPGS
jgi:TolB protein